MGSSNLSSNWKALQKRLQSEKNTTDGAPAKRKRTNEDEDEDHHRSKKPKHKAGQLQRAQKSRKAMSAISNVQRARSKSEPQKPGTIKALVDGALKPVASHADLKAAATGDIINEGNSSVHVAGKFIAIDCEMVGIGPAPHTTSQLARVSLVNMHGEQIYDSFVMPKLPVTDYRTHVSGITPALLAKGRSFREVQEDVGTLLKGRILVGHALRNDLAVLLLSHPKSMTRDTSHHKPWKEQYCNGGIPSLRILARSILGLDSFQESKHSSIEDARAAMMLFKSEKEAFEADSMKKFGQVAQRPQGALKPIHNRIAQVEADTPEATMNPKKKKKKKKGKR